MQQNDTMETAFVVSDRIASEQFDDEMVLISIEKGVYYSLKGAAADIWTLLKTPQPVSRILAAFGLTPGGAEASQIEHTIARMRSDDLLLPAAEPAAAAPAALLYREPHFESFTDLAELIAIDPVHEVQIAAGWPVRPAGFPDPV